MSATILPFRGLRPRIHPEAFIAETAIVIGDVEIGPGSSIWYGCVVRGDVNKIRIGRNTNVQDGTIIHCNSDRSGADYRDSGGGMPTLIGDDVTIGHLALIHACRLESNCFIGMRAVVMDEAVVEPQAMVAAGALVSPRKVVGGGELWTGVPAKFRRHLGAEEQDEAGWIARHYVELAGQYLAERD